MEKALDAAHKGCAANNSFVLSYVKNQKKLFGNLWNIRRSAGYFLRDEPVVTDFAALGDWAKRIQAVDNRKFCYLNLFPTGEVRSI